MKKLTLNYLQETLTLEKLNPSFNWSFAFKNK